MDIAVGLLCHNCINIGGHLCFINESGAKWRRLYCVNLHALSWVLSATALYQGHVLRILPTLDKLTLAFICTSDRELGQLMCALYVSQAMNTAQHVKVENAVPPLQPRDLCQQVMVLVADVSPQWLHIKHLCSVIVYILDLCDSLVERGCATDSVTPWTCVFLHDMY
jgi:hypothetical protein